MRLKAKKIKSGPLLDFRFSVYLAIFSIPSPIDGGATRQSPNIFMATTTISFHVRLSVLGAAKKGHFRARHFGTMSVFTLTEACDHNGSANKCEAHFWPLWP